MLTGEAPLYLRRDLDDDSALVRPLRGAPPGVSRVQLWWPSGKIAGRYLTGFLAAGGVAGRAADRPPEAPADASGRSGDAIGFGHGVAGSAQTVSALRRRRGSNARSAVPV